MTDKNCPMCGWRVDLLNESQPVCPRCGTDPFEKREDFGHELDGDDEEPEDPADAAEAARRASFLQALLQKYATNRTGLGHARALQDVCLECRGLAVKKEGSRRECLNSQCQARWLVNHCWRCRSGLDSRETGAYRCALCKGQVCAECHACYENCREWRQREASSVQGG